MTIAYVSLPVVTPTGIGAPVSIADLGIEKTAILSGDFIGEVQVEISHDGVEYIAGGPACTQACYVAIDHAAEFARVRTRDVGGSVAVIVSGLPRSISCTDLVIPVGNGVSPDIDVSELGPQKTFYMPTAGEGGVVSIEASINGADYVSVLAVNAPSVTTVELLAQRVRGRSQSYNFAHPGFSVGVCGEALDGPVILVSGSLNGTSVLSSSEVATFSERTALWQSYVAPAPESAPALRDVPVLLMRDNGDLFFGMGFDPALNPTNTTFHRPAGTDLWVANAPLLPVPVGGCVAAYIPASEHPSGTDRIIYAPPGGALNAINPNTGYTVSGLAPCPVAISALWCCLLTTSAPSADPWVFFAAGGSTQHWLYNVRTNAWTPTALGINLVGRPRAARAPDGTLYIMSGNIMQQYVPATDSWFARAPLANSPGNFNMLADGRILACGRGTAASTNVFVYYPTLNSWFSFAPLNVARQSPLTCNLRSGKVLVAGGRDGGGTPLTSCEVYDPAGGGSSVNVGALAQTHAQASAGASLEGNSRCANNGIVQLWYTGP